jgi:hypothetical protein
MTSVDDRLPPLPTFIVVGAQKSATRWLRENLSLHPSVFTAQEELSYFDNERRWALGPDFYRSQFAGWDGEPIVGESTPGYLMPRNQPEVVARRISESVPDVRLVAVLRNPVDRAQSALIHHIRYGRLRPSTDLLTFVCGHEPDADRLGLVAGGRYAEALDPFVRRFGDQLLVVLHDEVRDEPAEVFARAAAHVGADGVFVPPELDQVRFSNRAAGGEAPVAGERPLSTDERRELFEWFRDDVDRLQDLLGRDLSAWKPAA